jgi:hypothetical protein
MFATVPTLVLIAAFLVLAVVIRIADGWFGPR